MKMDFERYAGEPFDTAHMSDRILLMLLESDADETRLKDEPEAQNTIFELNRDGKRADRTESETWNPAEDSVSESEPRRYFSDPDESLSFWNQEQPKEELEEYATFKLEYNSVSVTDSTSISRDDSISSQDPAFSPTDREREPGLTNVCISRRPKRYARRESKEVYAARFYELSQLFHLSREDAAKELDISVTLLKRRCRQAGIQRWPYRKIKAVRERLQGLRESIPDAPMEKREKHIYPAIRELTEVLDKITCNPDHPLPRPLLSQYTFES